MAISPARKSVAVSVQKGQSIKVINTHGKQVVDFWAFNPQDHLDYLSMVHTRTVLTKISIALGDSLYSTKRKAMLKLTEDTTPGVHDLVWSVCDTERYAMQGFVGYHDNCADNMHSALKISYPDFKIADKWVPDPLNLFMNVAIDHRGSLDIRPPVSEKGQYVVLKAETDLIIVMSACPQDLAPVNAGMPTDCEYEIIGDSSSVPELTAVPYALNKARPKVKVCLSFDFDAVSHWLGTGCHPDNNMADYSSGIFAGQVGSIRLLSMLKKMEIADKVTWFIPGHTMETFPSSVQKVVESGAEIGLHGYSHEGIYQMTPEQERDVLVKCIEVATKLCGEKPRGYRAPMYTIRETTIELLREHGFLYDSSLMHHDCQPYWTPADPPIQKIDFSKAASSWLKPTPIADREKMNPLDSNQHPLITIPCGWYSEDMMPLQYLPHLPNSMGYVSTRVIEQMWKDKFMWCLENYSEDVGYLGEEMSFVFPILMHPDTSGMAHILGMSERVISWLKSWGDTVQFCTHEEIASVWLKAQKLKLEKAKAS